MAGSTLSQHTDSKDDEYDELTVVKAQAVLSRHEKSLPGRYQQWTLTQQLLFWGLLAVLVAGLAAALAYAVPVVFSVVALPLIKLAYIGLVAAFTTLMLGLLCDGAWVKRSPSAQLGRTILLTFCGLAISAACVLVFSPGAFAVLPALLDKFFPAVVGWLPGLKVAVLASLALAWSGVCGAFSYLFAKFSESNKENRWGLFWKGISWGFAIGAAAIPTIFMAKFIVTEQLVAFFAAKLMQLQGTMVFASVLPAVMGAVGGLLNVWWKGDAVADARPIADSVGQVARNPLTEDADIKDSALGVPAGQKSSSGQESLPFDVPIGGDASDQQAGVVLT